MPEEPEVDDRPVFRWKIDSAAAPSVGRFGAGGKPEFGIPALGRLVVTVLVVSASVGLFIFLGAGVGLGVAHPLGPRGGLWVMIAIAGAGGVLGVVVGTRLAFKLTDVEKTRPRLVGSAVGGIAGLALGSGIPAYFGIGFAVLTPLLAIAGPGLGAVGGVLLAGRWTAWRAKRNSSVATSGS